MKFSNPLRRLFSRDKQLAALNAGLAAAGDIPEIGERMLRYKEIERSQPEDDRLRGLASALSFVGFIAGFVLAIGGAITFGLPGFLGGAALLVSSAFAGVTMGADTDEGFERLHKASRAATKNIIAHTPLASFARSPKFEAVMATFPDLKEQFVLSAARDRVMEADAAFAPQARKEVLSL